MPIRIDAAYAEELDARDPLASMRERFVFADPDLIYVDGNSLGRLPKASMELAQDLVVRQWGERLIRGWNDSWFEMPERIGAKIARLIGAQPDEVIIADSTSINLFKLVIAALRAQQGRSQILTDTMNFPSDLYIFQGIIDLLGQQHQLEVVASRDGIHGPAEALQAALNERTALLTLSHTVFKSGYMYDMAEMTTAAHRAGALVLWDLSHSVGSVVIDLNAAGADLAVGCTYKYVNGGPGSPAFLYIRRDLQEKLGNPLQGWIGDRAPFKFELDYQPAPGLRSFLTGTPPIISLAMVEPGIDLLLEAGMEKLRAKSVQQTDYLIALWEAVLQPLGFTLNTPRESRWRGSHVSLGHEYGLGIDLALINDVHVLPDFRPPDNIRLGLVPLYTSFRDVNTTVGRLQQIVNERLYEKYAGQAPTVI
jgi:kynureninase